MLASAGGGGAEVDGGDGANGHQGRWAGGGAQHGGGAAGGSAEERDGLHGGRRVRYGIMWFCWRFAEAKVEVGGGVGKASLKVFFPQN